MSVDKNPLVQKIKETVETYTDKELYDAFQEYQGLVTTGVLGPGIIRDFQLSLKQFMGGIQFDHNVIYSRISQEAFRRYLKRLQDAGEI